MDVNGNERLFNNILRHKFKKRNSLLLLFCISQSHWGLQQEAKSFPNMSVN